MSCGAGYINILDTFLNPDGTSWTGSITYTLMYATTVAGATLIRARQLFNVSDGIDLCLAPGLYDVVYNQSGQDLPITSQWTVPSSGGPYTVAQISTGVFPPGGTSVGDPGEIQYAGATAGQFDADADFVWDDTNKQIIIGGTSLTGILAGKGNNQNGLGNTGFGELALSSLIPRVGVGTANNTAMGQHAQRDMQDGSDNTAIGAQALRDNLHGYWNTAIGHYALGLSTGSGTQASGNTTVGCFGSNNLTTGSYNTVVGMEADWGNTTGSYGVVIGRHARANFGGPGGSGSYNIAIGYESSLFAYSGSHNVGLGAASLYVLSTGSYNTCIGDTAGPEITTGSINTILGASSGGGLTTGSGNTIIGANVLGLAADLTNNIIIASSVGTIKARHDETRWTFTDTVVLSSNLKFGGLTNSFPELRPTSAALDCVAAGGTDLYTDFRAGALYAGMNIGAMATSGAINLPNTGSVFARNAGNTSDVRVLRVTSTNAVELAGGGDNVLIPVTANASARPYVTTTATGQLGSGNLAAVATSGSASDLTSGTVAAARGGAGSVSGLLSADGAGLVSAASTTGSGAVVLATTPTFTSNVKFAGATNSFPELKRNAADLDVLAAGDTGLYTGLNVGVLYAGKNIGAVSTSGAINLPNTGSIFARNAANSADTRLLRLTSGNVVELGGGGDTVLAPLFTARDASIYDDTATTGSTLFSIRAGAGQSTDDLFSVLSNGNVKQMGLNSTYSLAWASAGSFDIGLNRITSKQILEVNNGTTGQTRDFRLRYLNQVRGANVASAATIALTGGVQHVTGTTAIDTITAPSTITDSGTATCVVLIPDGIFTWTTAGNIALAGTAVVNKALTMCYDPTTVKWYPSYV